MTTRASAQKGAATRARQSYARALNEERNETGVMLTAERVHQLRQARLRLERALVARDELIRKTVAEGGGLREVARHVGLSHAGVKKIVERG
jgi:endonuclease/exonuclease/phosphatase family metal-dependent hydrolase